jgi:hypothetical protein
MGVRETLWKKFHLVTASPPINWGGQRRFPHLTRPGQDLQEPTRLFQSRPQCLKQGPLIHTSLRNTNYSLS